MGLELRAFGVDAADLDVDFEATDRARVVTRVVARCALEDGEPLPASGVWALPVGVRLHALVAVCIASGWSELSRVLDCPAKSCDEEIEVELSLAALAEAALEAEASEPETVTWGEGGFRPRRPTGEDLLRWRDEPPSDTEILAALGGPEDGSPELVAATEEALSVAEPLVDLRVLSACPRCGQPLDVPIDVEREALALLRRAQDELLHDIGTLARAFHWAEHEIFALPADRRRRYLAMAERAEA
jgi:hypothetical protein